MREVQALDGDDGKRLDVVTRCAFSELSLGQIFKAIRIGKIMLNGQRVGANKRVCSGDRIQYYGEYSEDNTLLESANLTSCNESWISSNIQILRENEDFIILNKPRGIIVHGKDNSLESWISQHYTQHRSLSFKPGPCHRLDQQTTGIVVFAKTIMAARAFAQRQRENNFIKIYLGIVKGVIKTTLSWKHHLLYKDGKAFIDCGGKIAKTQVVPILCKDSLSLVIFYLYETGRTHQIRVQASEEGYPLFGDFKYAGGQGQYFLHAISLIDKTQNPLFSPIWALPVPYQDFIDFALVQKTVNRYKIQNFEDLIS